MYPRAVFGCKPREWPHRYTQSAPVGSFWNEKTIAIVGKRVASGQRQSNIAAGFEFLRGHLEILQRREVAVNEPICPLPIEVFDPADRIAQFCEQKILDSSRESATE